MRNLLLAGAAALFCLSLTGCGTWAKLPDHAISVVAVERLNKGEDFTFTVNIKDSSGELLRKVDYQYKVDWVGVEGPIHKAKSGVFQKIRVKGSPGTATLRILGYDAQDNFGEVAKFEFQIQ
jgi:hypothetical protein